MKIMEAKDKMWESGPHQEHIDKRIKEQIKRAAAEADRNKENLDDKGEGSYVEKNGSKEQQFEGLDSEPKEENKPDYPASGD